MLWHPVIRLRYFRQSKLEGIFKGKIVISSGSVAHQLFSMFEGGCLLFLPTACYFDDKKHPICFGLAALNSSWAEQRWSQLIIYFLEHNAPLAMKDRSVLPVLF
jgi:hypothetical protein